MIATAISVILVVGYATLIALITIGWLRLKVFHKSEFIPQVKVSVIIAVRNEAENIRILLISLLAQDYPSHLLEIIIVDDHSTETIVFSMFAPRPYRLRNTMSGLAMTPAFCMVLRKSDELQNSSAFWRSSASNKSTTSSWF